MEDCLQVITERRPRAVLDAGIGFGLWGHLLRQYLDVWAGRIRPEQWKTRIDGIEIDPSRVQPHSQHLYSHIFIGDIRNLVPQLASENTYDVILFGDVLEHLPKEDALALLRTATHLAADLVVVRLPLGDGWRKEGRELPDHHRSQWSLDDFVGHPATIRLYDYFGNPYVLLYIEARVQGKPFAGDVLADMERRLEKIEEGLLRIMEADHANRDPVS